MSTIILKRSNVAAKVPTLSDLVEGEIALNTTDGLLYTRDGGSNSIIRIGSIVPNLIVDGPLYVEEGATFNDTVTINADLTVTGTISGGSIAADTADTWTSARTITFDGDVSGSVSIDGSQDETATITVLDDSHNHTADNITDLEAAITKRRDYLINGDCRAWQRPSPVVVSSVNYHCDMFFGFSSGGTATRVEDGPDDNNLYAIQWQSGFGESAQIYTMLELYGGNTSVKYGNEYTFSVWVKAEAGRELTLRIRTVDAKNFSNTQDVIPDEVVIGSATGGWQRITKTFTMTTPLPSNVGMAMGIITDGSNDVLRATQWQLEDGGLTDFVTPDITKTLQAIKRYLFTLVSEWGSTSSQTSTVTTSVPADYFQLRTSPLSATVVSANFYRPFVGGSTVVNTAAISAGNYINWGLAASVGSNLFGTIAGTAEFSSEI